MNTRQAIEDYVYFRNQMDIKKLQNPIYQNYHPGIDFSQYFYPYLPTVGYQMCIPVNMSRIGGQFKQNIQN